MSAEAQTPSFITRKDYMSAGDELFVVGVPGTQQSPEFKAAKKKAHQDYYRQFVTDRTLAHVRARFGVEALAAALKADENLNSISLEVWDRLTWHPTNESPRPGQYTSARGASGPFQSHMPIDDRMIALTGEWVTRATLVCIAKQAARMLVEQAAAPATEARPVAGGAA